MKFLNMAYVWDQIKKFFHHYIFYNFFLGYKHTCITHSIRETDKIVLKCTTKFHEKQGQALKLNKNSLFENKNKNVENERFLIFLHCRLISIYKQLNFNDEKNLFILRQTSSYQKLTPDPPPQTKSLFLGEGSFFRFVSSIFIFFS